MKLRGDAVPDRVAALESALSSLPQVRDSCVLARDAGPAGRQFIAYIVSSGPFDEAQIRLRLAQLLPLDLAPDAFVPVWTLPTGGAGQLDSDELARQPIIDSAAISQIDRKVRSLPDVVDVAVVATERRQTVTAHHLFDLLPQSSSAAVDDQAARRAPWNGATEPAGAATLVPAVSIGAEPMLPVGSPATLAAALDRAARVSPTSEIVCIADDGAERARAYVALVGAAERITAGLRGLGLQPGAKVLLQLEDHHDLLESFWGCQFGGFVPVPLAVSASFSTTNGGLSRLQSAWQMLDRPPILAGDVLAPANRALAEAEALPGARVIPIDELRRYEPDLSRHDAKPDDEALLLLTSGSTGQPKGVPQTHRALLSQAAGSSAINGFSAKDVSLNWMPLDHVGGIVMFHVRDVFLACRQVHVATERVLRDPLTWLDLIERFRATLTWAPNFAFGLVNAREDAIRAGHWDLSSMRFILNGGEAIVARTSRRFLELLRPHKLPATCIHPAWGMSETSSGVTYSDNFSTETSTDADPFVEVGAPIPGFAMRIVDPQGQVVSEGRIGHLQVKGPSVTGGYYLAPDLNRRVFSADGWFETGDLGFLRHGRLTITGREKDVIIVNGINVSAHEIEAAVEEVPGVVISYTAACSIRAHTADTDRVAVFFSPARRDHDFLLGLLGEIRKHVVARVGVNPEYLIPVEPPDIPKTAIGKIQRSLLSQRFNAGEFASALKQVDVLTGNARTMPPWFFTREWRRKQLRCTASEVGARPALVFANPTGLGALVVAEMASHGRPIVTVETGPTFARLSRNRYRVAPGNPADFVQMMAAIAADGVQPSQIVHMWTCDALDAEVLDTAAVMLAQELGVFSLLFLAQALGGRPSRPETIDLLVVSRGMQQVLPNDKVCCIHGAVPGLVKSIPLEIAGVRSRHLDLGADADLTDAALVVAETSGSAGDDEVAYRLGERWIPRLRAVDFQQRAGGDLPFKRGGRYLMSGGLGGIGVQIAAYLLREFSANLLVIGTTPLAPVNAGDRPAARAQTRLAAYDELKKLPGDVVYEALDISDLPALRHAIDHARQRWNGELDGVIHLAGRYDERALADETRDSFAAILRPKLFGAWALSQVLDGLPEPVFVSFSSLSGRFGGALTAAYAAANSFLESFTHYLRSGRGFRSFCLEWSTWDDVGVSRGYALGRLVRQSGYAPISIHQGLDCFVAALCHDLRHVLIGLDGAHERALTLGSNGPGRVGLRAYVVANGSGVIDSLRGLRLRDRFGVPIDCEVVSVAELPRDETGVVDVAALKRGGRGDHSHGAAVPPGTDVERTLAGFWRDVLAVPQVGIDDDFFELGGNSLLATQVAARIQEAYHVVVSLRLMLEESTLAKLAVAVQRHVDSKQERGAGATPNASRPPGDVLARLDELSDDEVRLLLGEVLERRQGR